MVVLEDEGVVLQDDPAAAWRSYDPAVHADLRELSRGDWAWPVAVAALCQVDVWLLSPGDLSAPRVAVALGTLLASALLVLRRRSPMTVVVAVSVAMVLLWIPWPALQIAATVYPVIVALFAAGRYARRPAAYLAVPLVMVVSIVQEWRDPAQTVADGWPWALNALWVFALGAWLRQHDQLRTRVEVLTAQRERAAAAETRLEIARELHDVLAHSISMMVVQAEVADALFEAAPERARVAVTAVQDVGRQALGDMRRLVGDLRGAGTDHGSGEGDGSLAPDTASLAGLPELVGRFTAAGLPVTSSLDFGAAVPEATGRATYRVVQEALTNVLRHAGTAPTRLAVQAGDGAVVVDVDNDAPSPPPVPAPGGGHGLRGMEERLTALDGSLQAGPRPDGGFAVHARIPLT